MGKLQGKDLTSVLTGCLMQACHQLGIRTTLCVVCVCGCMRVCESQLSQVVRASAL